MNKPHKPDLPLDFIEAVMKFGYEDFFSTGGVDEPHQLQSVTVARDNYLHQMCRSASDIIRYAFGDGRQPATTDVSGYIRSKGPEAEAAFETLFTLCRKYIASVDAMPHGPGGGKTITPAANGMSDAEADSLKKALEVIWQAVPETNPRLIEGMEYVMESGRAVPDLFKNYWWKKNENRNDFRIAEKLENPGAKDDSFSRLPQSYEKRAAVARQTAENMEQLKPHAGDIAAHLLAWCLSRTLQLDSDYRVLDNSRPLAHQILGQLARGEKAIDNVATDIRKERYGKLLGKREWMKNDETRKRALVSAAGADVYLALALNVHKGAWFDRERDRLLKLADMQETAAYSLQTPIVVGSPLKLKARTL